MTAIRTPEGRLQEVSLSRTKAIKAFCTECFGWEGKPEDCTDDHCPLYPYRGKSMAYKGHRTMSDEQRQAASERLKEARAQRSGMEDTGND